eukprot:g63599.t1
MLEHKNTLDSRCTFYYRGWRKLLHLYLAALSHQSLRTAFSSQLKKDGGIHSIQNSLIFHLFSLFFCSIHLSCETVFIVCVWQIFPVSSFPPRQVQSVWEEACPYRRSSGVWPHLRFLSQVFSPDSTQRLIGTRGPAGGPIFVRFAAAGEFAGIHRGPNDSSLGSHWSGATRYVPINLMSL